MNEKCQRKRKAWVCSECDSVEYKETISRQDIQNLSCSECGACEFVLKEIDEEET